MGMDMVVRIGGIVVRGNEIHFLKNTSSGAVATESAMEGESLCQKARTTIEKSIDEDKDHKSAITMTNQDFTASFDGDSWVVKWKWKDKPPDLSNRVSCYSSTLKSETKGKFDAEIESWIAKGFLKPWAAGNGGVIHFYGYRAAMQRQSTSGVRFP